METPIVRHVRGDAATNISEFDALPAEQPVTVARSLPMSAPAKGPASSKGECSIHSSTMCPAFGSLRVSMRIEGMVPVLVGAVGCLYGLDFVSHFYGSSKPIVSPALTAKELIQSDLTDKVINIIKEVVDHEAPRMIGVMSLCTPETSGLHLELIPKRIGQTEIIPMRVPAYGVPTHAEAKDVAISGIIKRYGENFNAAGAPNRDGVVMLGEVFPTDPIALGFALNKMGVPLRGTLPNKDLGVFENAVTAKVVAAVHPFYDRTVKEFKTLGIEPIHSAPVGAQGAYSWLHKLGAFLKLDPDLVEKVATDEAQATADVIDANRLDGVKVMVAGYEGSELLFARLLLELGANVQYVSTSIKAGQGTREDAAWLQAAGVPVTFRKRHEDDITALKEYKPDLCVGSSNLEAVAKRMGIPAVYYTNIVSARPMLLSAGIVPIVDVLKGILNRLNTYQYMREFFADVDEEDTKAARLGQITREPMKLGGF